MTIVTIIGRGHSGTRAISHTLSASGFFMGEPLNESGDLVPAQDMYDACRVLAHYVHWNGDLSWNWDKLQSMFIPEEFTRLIHNYLTSVESSSEKNKGWKIPENTLVFPWLLRLFPENKYIFWIRNPRDCILGKHLTYDLNDFGISYPSTEDERLRRAISWKYQYDLVQSMVKPASTTLVKPKNWIEVRFEDFVFKQEETLSRIGDFLGVEMVKIPVQPETVDRWKLDQGINYYDFLEPAMKQFGYEVPVIT
jgi:hypothetical protein